MKQTIKVSTKAEMWTNMGESWIHMKFEQTHSQARANNIKHSCLWKSDGYSIRFIFITAIGKSMPYIIWLISSPTLLNNLTHSSVVFTLVFAEHPSSFRVCWWVWVWITQQWLQKKQKKHLTSIEKQEYISSY